MQGIPKRVALVSAAAAVLGLLAAILGFVAEGTKSKSFVRYDGRYCVYRATPALGCGIAAALLLLASQATVTAASGCFGRCRARARGEASTPGDERRRPVAFKLSVVSWVLAAVAVAMFLYGASRNTAARRGLAAAAAAAAARGPRGRRRGGGRNMYGCAVLGSGLFSTASVASFAASACAIAGYVYVEADGSTGTQAGFAGAVAPGVAMGQPYFQPHAADPAVAYPYPHAYGGGGGYGAKAREGTA